MKKNILKKGTILFSGLIISSSLLPTNIVLANSELGIEETERNILLDAEKPGSLDDVPEYYKSLSIDEIDNGISKKVYTFPDGSTFEISFDGEFQNVDSIFSRKMTSTAYGSRYNNHEFSLKRGSQRSSMRIDGYLARKGYGKSKFDRVFGGGVSGFGTAGVKDPKIIRKEEDTTNSLAALAELKWTVNKSIGASWGPFSGTISKGSTCFMYVAFIRGQIKVSDRIP